jgi:hypothetical protein
VCALGCEHLTNLFVFVTSSAVSACSVSRYGGQCSVFVSDHSGPQQLIADRNKDRCPAWLVSTDLSASQPQPRAAAAQAPARPSQARSRRLQTKYLADGCDAVTRAVPEDSRPCWSLRAGNPARSSYYERVAAHESHDGKYFSTQELPRNDQRISGARMPWVPVSTGGALWARRV